MGMRWLIANGTSGANLIKLLHGNLQAWPCIMHEHKKEHNREFKNELSNPHYFKSSNSV